MSKPWDNFPGDPLSAEDNKRLRYMLDNEEKMAFAFALARRWLIGAIAAIAGIVLFKENLRSIWLWIVK